ncbi:MAG: primosomal protein N' [Thermodesulfovibrionales bacterium]
MESLDILFPLNISPLTYNVPEDLKGLVKPGQFVKAHVKNTERVGLVIGRSSVQGLKPIKGLCGSEPIISEPLLKLIEWMSDYYMVNKGLVFKTMYSGEFFEAVSELSAKGGPGCDLPVPMNKGRYHTLLFHIPSFEEEISFLSDLSEKKRNIIILCPERSHIEKVEEELSPLVGERLSLLHGDLSKKKRREVYSRIISGRSDIVIGTRIAVFAPLRDLSTIVVLNEEDASYKNIQGMKFQGRDVAVMRGYLEKAEVVLSSTAPSVESLYNAMRGKYQFVRYKGKVRGKVEIIDMNRSPKVSPYISKRVIEVAKASLKKGGSILFLVNRKGYSLIRCSDCDYIEGCENCKVPLVYHRDKNLLLCHYCKKRFQVKELCPACGGATLETVGAGIQRIEAEIKRYLGVNPFRLEKGVKIEGFKRLPKKESLVIVSTGIIRQLIPQGFFSTCIFINPDIHLQFPDFKSGERLFQGLSNMRDWIRPDGSFLIQTRFPENHIYHAFRKGSIDKFYDIELSMRRSLLYPPFSRFATVSITSGEEDIIFLKEILNSPDVKELIQSCRHHESTLSGDKKRYLWRLVFKSSSKKRLHDGITGLIRATEGKKGIKIVVDVDPESINQESSSQYLPC